MNIVGTKMGIFSFAVAASTAMADIDPKQFDLNSNEQLEASELAALKAAVATSPSISEREHFTNTFAAIAFDYGPMDPVPLDELPKEIARRKCTNDNSRFVLRQSLTNENTTGCDAVEDIDGGPAHEAVLNGASLAYNKGFVANTEKLIIKGAIGYVFLRQNTMPSESDKFRSADWGYLAFLQADGTIQNNNTNEGFIQLGLKAERIFGGRKVAKTALGLSAYYLTDFDLKGEGYGLDISLIPYAAKYKLNGTLTGANGNYAYFVAKPSVNILTIKEAGTTGLVAGDDYLWIGGQFGIKAFGRDIMGHGSKLEAGVHAFKDLNGNVSAIRRYATIDLYLNTNRTAALQLSYVNGRTPTDFNETETLNIGLGFSL